eukprot:CAMPEP_0198218068 /NCGR_PEP_ID=MMETSP1445-20131203/67166_1 /TAXON_ID=36898 /ORGANISM="Pyramimonas sp., Strain CCMP2087" /LENGTH=193 /DNA_ID=CAMNT_0043894957 /DNA_START=624 /DNA_END=1202 /DNA_ORIENTATION=-
MRQLFNHVAENLANAFESPVLSLQDEEGCRTATCLEGMVQGTVQVSNGYLPKERRCNFLKEECSRNATTSRDRRYVCNFEMCLCRLRQTAWRASVGGNDVDSMVTLSNSWKEHMLDPGEEGWLDLLSTRENVDILVLNVGIHSFHGIPVVDDASWSLKNAIVPSKRTQNEFKTNTTKLKDLLRLHANKTCVIW